VPLVKLRSESREFVLLVALVAAGLAAGCVAEPERLMPTGRAKVWSLPADYPERARAVFRRALLD
jgi:hypothetical protein